MLQAIIGNYRRKRERRKKIYLLSVGKRGYIYILRVTCHQNSIVQTIHNKENVGVGGCHFGCLLCQILRHSVNCFLNTISNIICLYSSFPLLSFWSLIWFSTFSREVDVSVSFFHLLVFIIFNILVLKWDANI